MAGIKLTIADIKTGKSYQTELKEQDVKPVIGLRIGESVKGDAIGIPGYEFQVTGGSDNCGFPMRQGILGIRKKITSKGGVGFKKMEQKGMKLRKTVCGQKVHEKIAQLNLKVTVAGTKSLAEMFGKPEAAKEAPKVLC